MGEGLGFVVVAWLGWIVGGREGGEMWRGDRMNGMEGGLI